MRHKYKTISFTVYYQFIHFSTNKLFGMVDKQAETGIFMVGKYK